MEVIDTEGNISSDIVEDNERLKQYEILTYYQIKKHWRDDVYWRKEWKICV